jgi:D-serine deaminase-like pyridoxal phosphate-dependent protein
MVDSPDHINHINAISRKVNVAVPVCIDVDMSSEFPGLHFGVWRSGLRKAEDAVGLYRTIKESSHTRLAGMMGYEAQIAGVGDNNAGQAIMNTVIRTLKNKSAKEIAQRRANVVQALAHEGAQLRFVNGGGTGSLETTAQEDAVTEVTAGSGFFSSALFDNYKNFQHLPAAGFAIEVVRQPKPGMVTCHGGGYIASGEPTPSKAPKPYLPDGLQMVKNEGAGEVQTPLTVPDNVSLNLGDPVFLRHSKSGELCERFNDLHLVSTGAIQETIPTYRGEGKSFL